MPHSPARKRAGAHFFCSQRKAILIKASLFSASLLLVQFGGGPSAAFTGASLSRMERSCPEPEGTPQPSGLCRKSRRPSVRQRRREGRRRLPWCERSDSQFKNEGCRWDTPTEHRSCSLETLRGAIGALLSRGTNQRVALFCAC